MKFKPKMSVATVLDALSELKSKRFPNPYRHFSLSPDQDFVAGLQKKR